MTKVLSISNNQNLNAETGLSYSERESVVAALTEQGLPRVFNPNNYIDRIAESYGISVEDARSCLKEAISNLEEKSKREESLPKKEEKLYAQSGYFYPSNKENNEKEKDGMDSLAAFGQFQRLRFGLY